MNNSGARRGRQMPPPIPSPAGPACGNRGGQRPARQSANAVLQGGERRASFRIRHSAARPPPSATPLQYARKSPPQERRTSIASSRGVIGRSGAAVAGGAAFVAAGGLEGGADAPAGGITAFTAD